jgi:hypothetical protein
MYTHLTSTVVCRSSWMREQARTGAAPVRDGIYVRRVARDTAEPVKAMWYGIGWRMHMICDAGV